MKVVLNPSFECLRSFVETIPVVFLSTGTVIYEGRNILKRFDIGNYALVVKRFKKPNVINRFVYISFRSSKAMRSYTNALKLEKLNISTPQPVAYIEEFGFGLSYSYYITLEFREMTEIRYVCERSDKEVAVQVLEQFGRFTADIHKKNVLHQDYSPGNILFKVENGNIKFALVDVNRMSFNPISEEVGYKNFERLWLSEEAFVRIAKSYAASMGYDEAHAIERICYYKRCFMKE